jgi:hypothetical protein
MSCGRGDPNNWYFKGGPRAWTAQDLSDVGINQSIETNPGCGPNLPSNESELRSKGWNWPNTGEFNYSDTGSLCWTGINVWDYGCETNPGTNGVGGRRGKLIRNSYTADDTQCCLQNNSSGGQTKVIGDRTCNPTYRGHGSLGCQNVMSQQCTIDNFTGDNNKFNACKNFIEADPSSSQSRQVVQSLTRSYMTKYSPAEIRPENIVNFQDGSNIPEYLMDRCNASGACEAVLTEKCGNYNMKEISSELYQRKRELNEINKTEAGKYFIEYMGNDLSVTMIKPDDNGRDIYFAPIQLNGQSGYVMYSNPFGKTTVTSAQPSFNLWKNSSNTNVSVTLKDKSGNAIRRKQIKDKIEGLLMTLKWCGCHFPQDQYIDALQDIIECDIKCKTSGVQRFLNNEKKTCTDKTICVVDVANLAIKDSSVKDFNINQVCGTGTDPAQCYVNFEGVGIDSSEITSFNLANQQCGRSVATVDTTTVRPTQSGLPTMTLSSAIETKKLTVFLRDYEGLIPGRSLLLFLTIVLVSGLLLSIGTMFISPLIGVPLILLTFGFVAIYMVSIRYKPLRLVEN